MFKPVERAYRFIGKQLTVLAPGDLRDFSYALRKEFPNIKFCVFRDRGDFGRRDSRVVPKHPDALATRIEVAPDVRTEPRAPTRIVYFDNFDDCDSWGWCNAVLEPEGWKPEWEQNKKGEWYLGNERGPRFELLFSKFHSRHRVGLFRTELRAEAPGEEIVLREGRWYGGFYPWEEDQQRFLKAARRIFGRLTTNKYAVVDYATLEVKYTVAKGSNVWIGYHALEWARLHPRHFLSRNLKPIDWVSPSSA